MKSSKENYQGCFLLWYKKQGGRRGTQMKGAGGGCRVTPNIPAQHGGSSKCPHHSSGDTGIPCVQRDKWDAQEPPPSPLPEIIMNKCRVCEPWVADLEFTVKGSQGFRPGGWLCRDNKRITSKKSLCFVCSDFTQPALHGNILDSRLFPLHG